MVDTALAEFSIDGFRGTTIVPGDAGYDDARTVFNGMIDRRPSVIARCEQVSDVVAVVDFARQHDLPLSVYGGGHGVTGSAVVDAGVCLDMRGMRSVEVDPVERTARVAGGATWGEVDAATQDHGLAVTGGRVSTTGVAGLALGSGSGWLERAFGFVCDNLVEAEVVSADGRVVRASEEEHADLFWGLRGGGGNFGVVTEFVFRLRPLGPIVFGGMLLFPADAAADLVRAYRDFMATAPDEVDEDAMAFGQRQAPWNMHYLSMWPDPADTEANIAYTRQLAGAMKQWTTGRAYLNFIGDEGRGRVEAAFGPEKYARLAELKRTRDPTNLFRHNQNIAPAPAR